MQINLYQLQILLKKAEWINEATERLKNSAGKKTCMQVMEKKGRICCGATHRNKAKKFMEESKSIKEFLEKLNSMRGYTFKLKDNHTIVGDMINAIAD